MVQPLRTSSNQLEPLFDWGNQVYRVVWHEVGVVQLFWTCSNHSTTQCLCRFGRVEPPRTHEKLSYELCSLWSSVAREGSLGVEHPKLLSNTTHRPGSLCCTVVWTVSEELNHPEIISNSTADLALLSIWFEQVRKSWTTPNSWEIILWTLLPQELNGSRSLGWFNSYEPIQTIATTQGTKP